MLAISRIAAVTFVALTCVLAVRAVAAGDTPKWSANRALAYGTIDPIPPGAPQSVTATVASTSVMVRWLPPVDPGSYEVTHYLVSSEPATEGCLVERVTECVVANVAAGTYAFRVQALNGAGWGVWSAWSSPLTVIGPVPASLSVTGQRQGSRLAVRITSSGLALGTVVTVHAKSAGGAGFVAQRPTVTIGPTGTASWSAPWRDRRPVQIYAMADSLRSSTIRIR